MNLMYRVLLETEVIEKSVSVHLISEEMSEKEMLKKVIEKMKICGFRSTKKPLKN